MAYIKCDESKWKVSNAYTNAHALLYHDVFKFVLFQMLLLKILHLVLFV